MLDFLRGIEWGWVAGALAALFAVDKGYAALKRLWNAPAEVRLGILRRAEEIHAEQLQASREVKLAANADELLALVDRVGNLETVMKESQKLLNEALAFLRPNGGSSLPDQVKKLDQDFRAYVEDSQRWRRQALQGIERIAPEGPDAG